MLGRIGAAARSAVVMNGFSAALRQVTNRIAAPNRAELASTLRESGSIPFTLSAGVADTTMTREFDRLVRIADEALYQSKDAGRDRTTIGTAAMLGAPLRHDSEQDAAIDVEMLARS